MLSMKRHLLVSFHVRCLFFTVPLMPRMKPHHRDCCFVFGMVRVCRNCRDGFLMLVFVFLYFSTVPTVLGRWNKHIPVQNFTPVVSQTQATENPKWVTLRSPSTYLPCTVQTTT
jgi:hypothetical protein